AHMTIGLQQGREGQHTGFHGLFATRGRTIGRCQGVLERGIQQLTTVLAQKHKELARLACACSNFLFFRGQRNRRVPHAGLLQMGGARSSATYKSTGPPVVSTLVELLSKQLISVLGGGASWVTALLVEISCCINNACHLLSKKVAGVVNVLRRIFRIFCRRYAVFKHNCKQIHGAHPNLLSNWLRVLQLALTFCNI